MIEVSRDWKIALGNYNYPSRDMFVPENDIRIEYEQLDYEAQLNGTVSANSSAPYSTLTSVLDLSVLYSYRPATFEANEWGLNGLYSVLEGTPNIGWVSAVACGTDSAFTGTVPTLTISWDELQTARIPCIVIRWNETIGEFASEFTVKCYNGASLLWTENITGNTDIETRVAHEFVNYDKIEILVTKWCLPNARAKIETVYLGTIIKLKKSEIISASLEKKSDLLSFSLPENTMTFEIDNTDGAWNPDNPTGKYAYLLERQRVNFYSAYNLNNSYEWHKIATLFMSEWNTPQNGITASFTAKDLMSFMTMEFSPSSIAGYTFGDSISLYNLCIAAFTQASLPVDSDGASKWSVDTSLQGISVVIPYKTETREGVEAQYYDFDYSCAEVVQLCANAGSCTVLLDENGDINIVPVGNSLTDYVIDRFVSYSNGEYETQKILKSVLVNDTWQTSVDGISEGEIQQITNPLIQTSSVANLVANRTIKFMGKRRIGNDSTNAAAINGEYRSDIRLMPLDYIMVQNKYATNYVYITSIGYTYNGAFRGKYEGRVVYSIPNADNDYIYYSGGMYSNGGI